MKHSLTFCFFTIVFCLTTINTFAQTAEYFNENYTPTTAGNYFYKRVFKYKEPVAFATFGTNVYTGAPTIGVNQTGHHWCSFTDYYKTGEVAVVGTILAADIYCTQRAGYNGQVVAYYKNGNIKRREPWNYGKLHGVVIYYNESGNEIKREEYVEGKIIETEKFSVSADNPLLGTWKYIEYYDFKLDSKQLKKGLTFIFDQSGVAQTINQTYLDTSSFKWNWKYISKTCDSGILEVYSGNSVGERAGIKWINTNQIEYVVTFSQNADAVGSKFVFDRVGEVNQKKLCSNNSIQSSDSKIPLSVPKPATGAIAGDSGTAAAPRNLNKEQSVISQDKAADTRLVPPANRRFNHKFDIDVEYLKFENQTRVLLELPINSIEAVHLLYLFDGEKMKQTPKEVIFLFYKDPKRKFLSPVEDFVVLTDKDRFRIKIDEAQPVKGKIPYLAKFDYPTFLRIANAEKLDMKISNFEIVFNDDFLEAIKDLASRTSLDYKEDAKTVESKAIEKLIDDEIDKLNRTSSAVKTIIQEVVKQTREALTISQSSAELKVKHSAVTQATQTFVENNDVIPNGILKKMLDGCISDLVDADILTVVRAGILDQKKFDTEEIVRRHNLSDVPENKRPATILLNAEKTFTLLYGLVRSTKIIEVK